MRTSYYFGGNLYCVGSVLRSVRGTPYMVINTKYACMYEVKQEEGLLRRRCSDNITITTSTTANTTLLILVVVAVVLCTVQHKALQ